MPGISISPFQPSKSFYLGVSEVDDPLEIFQNKFTKNGAPNLWNVLRGCVFIPGLYSYIIPTLCKTEHFLIPTKILGKPTLNHQQKPKPSIPRVLPIYIFRA